MKIIVQGVECELLSMSPDEQNGNVQIDLLVKTQKIRVMVHIEPLDELSSAAVVIQ